MADFIAIVIIACIVGAALFYIRSEKKKGRRCIGCPSSGNCSGTCHCNDSKEKR